MSDATETIKMNLILELFCEDDNVMDILYGPENAMQLDEENDNASLTVVRRDRPKLVGYVEDVIPQYNLDDFRIIFRVCRTTFEDIIRTFGAQFVIKHPSGGGRPSVSAEKTALVALYYLGSQETIRKIAEKFELSESSVLACRERFCSTLTSRRDELIKWPKV